MASNPQHPDGRNVAAGAVIDTGAKQLHHILPRINLDRFNNCGPEQRAILATLDATPDASFGNPGVFKKKGGRPPKSPTPYIADPQTGCWTWQRGKNHRGYGLMWNGDKMVTAHRHYYQQFHGPIPDGMQVDHLCRNRACVNPAHLEAVTGTENVRRGNATKLTAQQVQEVHVLRAAGWSLRQLGQRFSVSAVQAGRIVTGKRWVDAKPPVSLPSPPPARQRKAAQHG